MSAAEEMKLLLVDDDDVDRERLRRMLDTMNIGAMIEESENSTDALNHLKTVDYDCILVDYMLGGDDGLELLSAIRKTLNKKCAVIMITGLGDEDIAAKALRLGANDYLSKNKLQPPKLFKAIFDAIRKTEVDRKVHALAHYDQLTGLVTRHLLIDRLQQNIKQVARSNTLAALAFIDLDDFKPVNDRYGHESGDEVLKEVSSRLVKTLRCTDTVARIGGDEFVILLPEIKNKQECEDLLKRVLLVLGAPIQLSNRNTVRVFASIGISLISDSQIDADTILRRSDHAMYQAKSAGKNNILFFDYKEEQKQRLHQQTLSQADQALKNEEFTLFYQPKINVVNGDFIGVEALIRWKDPIRGLLLPAQFEDILLHPKIGIKIGEWVIEKAIQQHDLWLKQGWKIKISVNVSPAHIHICDFIQRLDSLLEKYSYNTNNAFLEFEVLESTSLKDIEYSSDILNVCKSKGIAIALDDFGTGYASLKYLKQLPLDILKIDQSFIHNIESDKNNIAIVKSIVDLGNTFGYKLVAEGIETENQARKMIELGCNDIQGYLIARPMKGSDFIDWLNSYSNNNALDIKLNLSKLQVQ